MIRVPIKLVRSATNRQEIARECHSVQSVVSLSVLPRTRTNCSQHSFSFSDPAARNGLPADLQYTIITELFKKQLITVLIDRTDCY